MLHLFELLNHRPPASLLFHHFAFSVSPNSWPLLNTWASKQIARVCCTKLGLNFARLISTRAFYILNREFASEIQKGFWYQKELQELIATKFRLQPTLKFFNAMLNTIIHISTPSLFHNNWISHTI